MAQGIFSFFSNPFANIDLGTVAIWALVFVVLAVLALVIFFILLNEKVSTKTIEIDGNKRMNIFNGRIKKDKSGTEKYSSKKVGKELPRPQQKDLFLKGKKDYLILYKDNNGLHHTLRLPTWNEIQKWYLIQYNIDLEKEKDKNPQYKRLYDIFFLPNPHEDLDWLAGQCKEADLEFKNTKWWQSPTVMFLGTVFICFLMFIISQIITKKVK